MSEAALVRFWKPSGENRLKSICSWFCGVDALIGKLKWWKTFFKSVGSQSSILDTENIYLGKINKAEVKVWSLFDTRDFHLPFSGHRQQEFSKILSQREPVTHICVCNPRKKLLPTGQIQRPGEAHKTQILLWFFWPGTTGWSTFGCHTSWPQSAQVCSHCHGQSWVFKPKSWVFKPKVNSPKCCHLIFLGIWRQLSCPAAIRGAEQKLQLKSWSIIPKPRPSQLHPSSKHWQPRGGIPTTSMLSLGVNPWNPGLGEHWLLLLCELPSYTTGGTGQLWEPPLW